MPFTIDRFSTPIGMMRILVDEEDRLRMLDWEDHEDRMLRLFRLHYNQELVPGRTKVRDLIEAYFAGDLDALDRIAVLARGTAFQQEVWAALRTIPAGTTLSYSGLAKQIGRPAAVRAVGLANGSNPIGVVVPCHRVIGANGSLTGYGGGLERKSWLLNHEGAKFTRTLWT
ncbi:MAG TPA: methylated-DNA--[protein]-cysteine S-methyltransferase [Bryobacteraceae bacterium]|nr:methylated-DNA--[protein]-cysteine S-methyltransferase [Bryobacteraceae bacterium]